MSLREALDSSAEEAMTGRRLDAAAAQARARQERRTPRGVLRLAGGVAGRVADSRGVVVLAAAAAVLLVVLLAWPSFSRLGGEPAGPSRPAAPIGIPSRLYAPPAWTPLVTEQPIASAGVALLDERGRAYVVSSDGRQYRRLPNDPDGQTFVVLSPDGSQVAWGVAGMVLNAFDGSQDRGPTVLHVLRFGAGETVHDVRIPDLGLGATIHQVAWTADGSRLYVTGDVVTTVNGSGSTVDYRAWRLDRTATSAWDVADTCVSCRTSVTTLSDGRVMQAYRGDDSRNLDPDTIVTWPTDTEGAWTGPTAGSARGAGFLIEPTQARAVTWVTSNVMPPPIWTLGFINRSGSTTGGANSRLVEVGPSDRFGDAALLVWNDFGVLIRLSTVSGPERPSTTLEWVSPETGQRTVASRVEQPSGGWALPVSVAFSVAASPNRVAGVEPSWPWWSPVVLRYQLTDSSWFLRAALLAAVVALVGGLTRRAVRRRRSERGLRAD